MGKQNDVLLDYFDDNERFADLCNGVLFGGRPVIDPEKLEDASERYTQRGKDGEGRNIYRSRYRDVKKRLKDGGTLRILAVEAQELVDYSMPLRCMNYDVQEYLKQLKRLQAGNDRRDVYHTAAERFCRLLKSDRLAPVYTICLYHGEEEWDGPVSLKEMMDFGNGPELFRSHFQDYSFVLLRADQPMDYGKFRTSLREVLEILPCRKDKNGLMELMNRRKEYRSLDRETMEVIAVMTNNRKLMEDVEAYRVDEKYDLCEALKGIREDGIEIGIEKGIEKGMAAGLEKGIHGMIVSLRECAVPDAVILQKLQKRFALTAEKAEAYLQEAQD